MNGSPVDTVPAPGDSWIPGAAGDGTGSRGGVGAVAFIRGGFPAYARGTDTRDKLHALPAVLTRWESLLVCHGVYVTFRSCHAPPYSPIRYRLASVNCQLVKFSMCGALVFP